MLILFFDSKEVVYKEYVPEDQTVTKEFYFGVLVCLLKQIARVRQEVWKNRNFSFFHDNASAHTTTIIVEQFLMGKKLKNCTFNL